MALKKCGITVNAEGKIIDLAPVQASFSGYGRASASRPAAASSGVGVPGVPGPGESYGHGQFPSGPSTSYGQPAPSTSSGQGGPYDQGPYASVPGGPYDQGQGPYQPVPGGPYGYQLPPDQKAQWQRFNAESRWAGQDNWVAALSPEQRELAWAGYQEGLNAQFPADHRAGQFRSGGQEAVARAAHGRISSAAYNASQGAPSTSTASAGPGLPKGPKRGHRY
ncbi:hypothetical protein E4K73_50815 [Streptomyces sp. IB201691-2A2]|nr:hypothetical protein E4K73_50815 [Streptomyces sp. IB201691-2A2]